MSDDRQHVKEIADIESDITQWYTDVVLKSELADYSPVRGSMVIRPYGCEIWENIRGILDGELKKSGHKNAVFPLFIPESLLNNEKDHVEGFAPEVAWVTQGGGETLEERLCVRPTSETLFSTMYSRWIKSWRDLPLKLNQWCNVVRWEKTTRPFLRSSEFLWQEGHTVHAGQAEAAAEVRLMLDTYADFVEKCLAIPVVKGRKSDKEKFAGAVATYTIEAMLRDGKALQCGTSHNFGQNFSIPFGIRFQDKDGELKYCWQTSWGVSTRLIGALIMMHGDERGLVLPPAVAPVQIVIIPVAQHKGGVLEKCREIASQLAAFRVEVDDREQYSPGWKFNEWEMKGAPLRLEIGPRDIEKSQVVLARRDTGEKTVVAAEGVEDKIAELLQDIRQFMYREALRKRDAKTRFATTPEELQECFEQQSLFVYGGWCGNRSCEDKIKEQFGATIRCIPLEQPDSPGRCAICGAQGQVRALFARAY